MGKAEFDKPHYQDEAKAREYTESTLGIIEGHLQMARVHGGLEFEIYRNFDDRCIKAVFSEDELPEEDDLVSTAKSYLGKYVYATGEVIRDKRGLPKSILVFQINIVEEEATKVDPTTIFGILPEFTGGLSVDEYLKKQRGEEPDA